jgi:hypothetical protein
VLPFLFLTVVFTPEEGRVSNSPLFNKKFGLNQREAASKCLFRRTLRDVQFFKVPPRVLLRLAFSRAYEKAESEDLSQ